jgi:hypothetical protein
MNNIDEAKEYMDEHECNCFHCRQAREQQVIEPLPNAEPKETDE